MAPKLQQIILVFDDGTKHEVGPEYNAVYRTAERARKAGEKEPWADPPKSSYGKDEAIQAAGRCYILNGVIVCP